ncbi:hypothetical protein PIB30_071590 [Stylosanthes scabra]|uniref:Uncharacterized protein n=1 Tax=Stylosanthes scabra TaxID=79078 RepID=A0ABU6YMS1_9FABA|nr:hypothetical protein [Stylosanthes scabra]
MALFAWEWDETGPAVFHMKHQSLNAFCQSSIISQLGHCCNRILLLDLVDELLSEILARPRLEQGLLVERVYVEERWGSFRGAKYEFLEDINGLIQMEEMERKVKEEREERLVMEIGKIILGMVAGKI